MRAERARKRDETIDTESPKRIKATVVAALCLLGLYWWAWSSWFVLALLGLAILSVAMDTLMWRNARRRLKQSPSDAEPSRAARQNQREERQNRSLGNIEWRADEESWCTSYRLDEEEVVVRLEGTREDDGPTDAAKELWNAIEPRLPELWAEVASYATSWSHRESVVPLDASDLELDALDLSPSNPAEEGEVGFHFRAATDLDGTYFVALHDGKALFVHRDS